RTPGPGCRTVDGWICGADSRSCAAGSCALARADRDWRRWPRPRAAFAASARRLRGRDRPVFRRIRAEDDALDVFAWLDEAEPGAIRRDSRGAKGASHAGRDSRCTPAGVLRV